MTSNHFNQSQIRSGYVEQGQKIEVYDQNQSAPRTFLLFNDQTNEYQLMKLYPDEGPSQNTQITETLIQWRENTVDTVQSVIIKSKGSGIAVKSHTMEWWCLINPKAMGRIGIEVTTHG